MICQEEVRMFTNIEGCTIYEKTVVNRAPAYVRHVTGPVYWESSTGETDGKDRTEQNNIFVSVPSASVTYVPKNDDRIVGMIIGDETPPKTAFTVMNVKDLRYGSPRVQHIEITAR